MTIQARKDLVGRTVRVRTKSPDEDEWGSKGKVTEASATHLTVHVDGINFRFAWGDILSVYPIVNKEK